MGDPLPEPDDGRDLALPDMAWRPNGVGTSEVPDSKSRAHHVEHDGLGVVAGIHAWGRGLPPGRRHGDDEGRSCGTTRRR